MGLKHIHLPFRACLSVNPSPSVMISGRSKLIPEIEHKLGYLSCTMPYVDGVSKTWRQGFARLAKLGSKTSPPFAFMSTSSSFWSLRCPCSCPQVEDATRLIPIVKTIDPRPSLSTPSIPGFSCITHALKHVATLASGHLGLPTMMQKVEAFAYLV